VPETAKSELGRRLSLLTDGTDTTNTSGSSSSGYFQRLLTKFTTPEELFGPLSLKSLEMDIYRRCTDGYLPTCRVAFLDELFKANSAILNTLLTILQERTYDGKTCPLLCVVGASNELPQEVELEALYDRFLLRKVVEPVSDEGLMELMGLGNPGVYDPCLEAAGAVAEECELFPGLEDMIEHFSTQTTKVIIPPDICTLMVQLRNHLRQQQPHTDNDDHYNEASTSISDRRMVKATKLLKLSAATHGRLTVDRIDCLALLPHMLWNVPHQQPVIQNWLLDNVTPLSAMELSQLRLVVDQLRAEVIRLLPSTGGSVALTSIQQEQLQLNNNQSPNKLLANILTLTSLHTECTQLSLLLSQQYSTVNRHIELLTNREHLWMDDSQLKATRQLLIPRAQIIQREIRDLWTDAIFLELVLSPNDTTQPNIEELHNNTPASPSERSRPSLSNAQRLSLLPTLQSHTHNLDGTQASNQHSSVTSDEPTLPQQQKQTKPTQSSSSSSSLFTQQELELTMREGKQRYGDDLETFRLWKRARKKFNK